jgi:hypothetical protein
MNMKIQYCNKIRWGLAPLAPNDAPPLCVTNKNELHTNAVEFVSVLKCNMFPRAASSVLKVTYWMRDQPQEKAEANFVEAEFKFLSFFNHTG